MRFFSVKRLLPLPQATHNKCNHFALCHCPSSSPLLHLSHSLSFHFSVSSRCHSPLCLLISSDSRLLCSSIPCHVLPSLPPLHRRGEWISKLIPDFCFGWWATLQIRIGNSAWPWPVPLYSSIQEAWRDHKNPSSPSFSVLPKEFSTVSCLRVRHPLLLSVFLCRFPRPQSLLDNSEICVGVYLCLTLLHQHIQYVCEFWCDSARETSCTDAFTSGSLFTGLLCRI